MGILETLGYLGFVVYLMRGKSLMKSITAGPVDNLLMDEEYVIFPFVGDGKNPVKIYVFILENEAVMPQMRILEKIEIPIFMGGDQVDELVLLKGKKVGIMSFIPAAGGVITVTLEYMVEMELSEGDFCRSIASAYPLN